MGSIVQHSQLQNYKTHAQHLARQTAKFQKKQVKKAEKIKKEK
ncbi:hypothetical protein Metlim_1528 [Methanoplanus limicola DSM 2279]|uniref:Uncharacterized protein n=1 Tax=Methanoplanus limicola DSM 2279 TaxID=937775 RepID=H1Z3N0_9EURY|nr:hypothetical protein Metlim_1528 [Methanoplanus limicola DSM 2279]